jgi:WD40-like Beta Propeller Repeat
MILGASAPRRAAGAVLLAALVALLAYLLLGRGAPATAPVNAPARVALVYANPIGTGIAVRGEEIDVATPSGSHAVRLAKGMYPSLSPDGRWVAYIGGGQDRPGTIRLVSTLGGEALNTRIAGAAFAWSPDSRMLAVQASHGTVILLDPRTLRRRVITLHPGGFDLTFSPDGSALAYETNGRHGPDIYTVTIEGGVIRRLTTGGRSGSPLWGPDGIAFERYAPRSCANCLGDVWIVDTDGSDARPLTHTHGGIYPAAWSADGTRMLAAYPATHNGRLYAVDVATGRARPLTPFVGDLFPQGLSRDGRTVLASIGCGGLASPYGVVETIPFAGGAPTIVARGPCAASSNF